MFKSHPLTMRFALFLLGPAIVCAIVVTNFLNSSLPQTHGEISIAGIGSQVSVTRDEYGVPYIAGKDQFDVYFAMGFVHAQDRMWQLELQRRIARGRLSEIFGKGFVTQDAWFRTLGLYESAATSQPALSERSLRALSAYAAGINAWLETGKTLPVEFSVYGVRPESWRVEDSLAWIKVFALDLGGNFNSEIERFLTAQFLPPAHREFLHEGYPQDAPLTIEDGADAMFGALLGLRLETEDKLQIGGRFVGSNAWVVSGTHTESGKPILANDPHLGLQMPSLWYAVSLEATEFKAAGMSLVGLPLIVFGQNGHIAWGGTNMMADTQDLYLEQVNPSNPQQYKVGEEWRDFQVRTELIEVRPDFPSLLRKPLKPIALEIRTSRHGPIVSDVVGAFEQPAALRWTALDPGDTTFDAFLALHYAKNWTDFKSAMSLHVAPAMNMLYVDRENNVGYLGVGRIPVRKNGEGTAPVPGWTDQYEWISSIPSEQMPWSLNPDVGYIVSANNRIAGDGYPYFISHDWAPPARAQRIGQLIRSSLEGGGKLDVVRMQTMQADTLSLPATRLLPVLTALRPQNEQQRAAISVLAKWDGDMASHSVAASIFHVWTRHLREALFADEVSHYSNYWNKPKQFNLLSSVVARVSLDQMAEVLTRGDVDADEATNWCDNIRSPSRESCEDMMLTSLAAALAELTKLKGSDVDDWSWAEIQRTEYAHVPFSGVKALGTVFGREVPGAGSPDTINVASSYFKESEGYLQNFGAGFRQVIELGHAPSVHRMMNSTGQSGHFLSPHYDDMMRPFHSVEFHSLGEVRGAADSSTLVLRPRN